MSKKSNYDAVHKRATERKTQKAGIGNTGRDFVEAAFESAEDKKARQDAENDKYDPPKEDTSCFLTTACVEHAGLPDNCHELTTLRSFRDNYMRSLPNGDTLISDYYENAPRIVSLIQLSEKRNEILDGILTNVKEAVSHIENGSDEDALRVYGEMYTGLKQEFQIA